MNLNYARGLLWLLCLLLGGCCVPTTKEYRAFYSHLRESIPCTKFTENQENFLVIYVDARHLDYTDNVSFFKTVAKHPSDGSKNRDVGHAWIYLQGVVKGNTVFLEGGHSGELGIRQAKYFDGIMNYIDFGYANPTDNQLSHPRYEPNPVKYLWETQHDGFFQWGQGRHRPSFAVKIGLTTEQLEEMIAFVQLYNYHEYSLVENQCCSFVKQVAALVDLELDCEVTIPVCSQIVFNGEKIRFWEDPFYSELTISSPDVLEKSLMQAVREGKVEFFTR